MRINVNNLKISLDKLKNLLDDYEDIYKSFYHKMVNLKGYWHDAHANAFFEKIREEKKSNVIFFRELKSICRLYNYIYSQYLNVGGKIDFDLSNKEIFINKIDKYINNIDSVINDYANLESKFDLSIDKYLNDEKKKYNNVKEKLLLIKEKNKEYINNIFSIEKQIKLKISKIHIRKVSSNSTFISGIDDNSDVYVDIDNINLIINKLEFFVKNESIIFDSINEIFSEIIYLYDTENKDKLNTLLNSFIRKYRIIIKNHKNNILLIRNSKEKYDNIVHRFDGDIV